MNGSIASPLDTPPLQQPNLGWHAMVSAVALHCGLVALLVTGAHEHASPKSPPLRVTHMVEVDLPPPSAADDPAPLRPSPPQATAPAAPTVKPPKPRTHEPGPAPAHVGEVLSAADEMIDFGNTIVSGTGSHFAGGVSAANGTARAAARDAKLNGVPGGTGDAEVDRSRPPSLGGAAVWDCPFPPEADDAGIDHAVVTLHVDVAADGGVVRAIASSDPGQGFGREALRCAKHKTWSPARDRSGRTVAGVATVRVRFDR